MTHSRSATSLELTLPSGPQLRWASLASLTGLAMLGGFLALNPYLLTPPTPWIAGAAGYLLASVLLQLHAPRGIAVLISYLAAVSLLALTLSIDGFSWVAVAVAVVYGSLAFGSWMLLTWFAATVLAFLRPAAR